MYVCRKMKRRRRATEEESACPLAFIRSRDRTLSARPNAVRAPLIVVVAVHQPTDQPSVCPPRPSSKRRVICGSIVAPATALSKLCPVAITSPSDTFFARDVIQYGGWLKKKQIESDLFYRVSLCLRIVATGSSRPCFLFGTIGSSFSRPSKRPMWCCKDGGVQASDMFPFCFAY